MTSNFVFCGQKMHGNLDVKICCQKANHRFEIFFRNFVFRSQRMNGNLGTILNFLFRCENQMIVWAQL